MVRPVWFDGSAVRFFLADTGGFLYSSSRYGALVRYWSQWDSAADVLTVGQGDSAEAFATLYCTVAKRFPGVRRSCRIQVQEPGMPASMFFECSRTGGALVTAGEADRNLSLL